MERPTAHTTAARTAHDDRAPRTVTVSAGCGKVREHVEAARDEVDELHLGNWPHPHVGRADCGADNALVHLMADCGFVGAMLDTADKRAGRLLDCMDAASLRNFVSTSLALPTVWRKVVTPFTVMIDGAGGAAM